MNKDIHIKKINELEKHLLGIDSGDKNSVKAGIENFSINVQLDDDSVLNKQSIIDECFSKNSVEEIINSLETESGNEGNAWINSVLAGLKKSSPLALKITLRSIRDGRNQTLSESLRKEFRVTMNILRNAVSGDMYEGIRALAIDKDNAPKWDPPSLDKVDDEKVDFVFRPFQEELELAIPETEDCRWGGKFENSAYTHPQNV